MDDFVVSTRASTVRPVIQWLGGTSLVIVWTDFARGRLKAATFGVSGDPLRAAFDVNDAELAQSHPVVAAIPGSSSPGFVVVWTTETRKVELQRFNGEARPVGGIIQVNTADADPEHAPAIASLTDGNFAVTWGDFGVGAIRGQVFRTDGIKLGPVFAVSTSEGLHTLPAMTPLMDAGFVVAWQDTPGAFGGAVRYQVFDPDGSKSGPEQRPEHDFELGPATLTFVEAASNQPADMFVNVSAVLADDEQIIAVTALGADNKLKGIVNATHRGDRTIGSSPSVKALPDRRLLVTWVQKPVPTLDKFEHKVMASVVAIQQDNSLAVVGPTFQVDNAQPTFHGQDSPCVSTSIGDAGVVAALVWTDASLTNDPSATRMVKARILTQADLERGPGPN